MDAAQRRGFLEKSDVRKHGAFSSGRTPSICLCMSFLITIVVKKPSGRPELNRRPLGPEPSALPSALLPVWDKKARPQDGHIPFFTGVTGLEPAISGLTGQRDKPTSLHPQGC